MADVFVTNFHKRFTGVSATANAVLAAQLQDLDIALVGDPLPDGPAPIGLRAALSQPPPAQRPFAIWHVRRNAEMWAGLYARDILRRPVKLVFTSAAIRRHSALPRWLISRMDAVIATTQAAAGFVPHVAAVVPHGVRTQAILPAPDRAAAWAATGLPGTKAVATIGRIRPEKGTDRFVDAMIETLPAQPGLTALVIGKATSNHVAFQETLKARIQSAGLAERILFLGEKSPDALHALLPALSAVVQLPIYEGYGVVPLEAMSAATPFLATDTGHYRAFSSQGRCGKIVTPSEVPEALRTLLGPATHAEMSAQARDIAVSAYDVSQEAAGINAVYERLWAGDLF